MEDTKLDTDISDRESDVVRRHLGWAEASLRKDVDRSRMKILVVVAA